MTKKEVREYLYRVRVMIKREQRIIAQMTMLETRQMTTTRVLSDMPRGGKPFTTDDYVIGMEDLKSKFYACLAEERQAYVEILNALDQLEGLVRESMIMYYLMFMSWEEIAVKLGKSYRQVQNYHKTGIEKISKIL